MTRAFWVGILVLAVIAPGCSRTRHRLAADRDAYCLLQQRTLPFPWAPPSDYTLHPDPQSRLHDPTPLDDPALPWPAPQLYAYRLPELPGPSLRSHGGAEGTVAPGEEIAPPAESIPAPPEVYMDARLQIRRLPAVSAAASSPAVQLAAFQTPNTTSPSDLPPAATPPATGPGNSGPEPVTPEPSSQEGDTIVLPIPTSAWQSVPNSCRMRMLEFPRLVEEYQKSFQRVPGPEDLSPGQRLSLEDIVYLTLLNSREYQTQKETLYRVALRLSLERFAYQARFAPFANNSATTWNHTRSGGTTVNSLGIGTGAQIEKVLLTGGDFLVRFANSVVLTFNGPNGFAADVGSDLFYELDQTLLQVDVRFENLTQAERDLIYAARDFTRFRRTLFVQLGSQYYSLIRTFRQVEIDSQNYFALVRAFMQSTAEFSTISLPRIQVDQVEQNVLSGRSRLIATCNNLESALDNLKIRIGLPTETQINLDLTELEQLTARDELSVAGELVLRVRDRLAANVQIANPARVPILNDSIVLIERMVEARQIRERLGVSAENLQNLEEPLRLLRVALSRDYVSLAQQELNREIAEQRAQQQLDNSRLYTRLIEVVQELLALTNHQLELALPPRVSAMQRDALVRRHRTLRTAVARIGAQFEEMDPNQDVRERLAALVQELDQLRADALALAQELDQLLQLPPADRPAAELLQEALTQARLLLTRCDELLQSLGDGLTPIEIEVDDAMMTALNLRFDLMNQRGEVADAWRQIKYAGDDLRSILRLNASQRLSTRADVNRPFDFDFDESNTRIRASFDAPFNRVAQRNTYRQSLINYQASLRQLMLLEDTIKLGVRNDLRNLSLDKEQYAIEVASAALAYERVVSVRLELRLGVGRATARDFLEAQNAYVSSLSNVAARHIGYIVDRTQLFVDLELLQVGDDGFWHELYDEGFQPEPFYQLPAYSLPVYGELVPGLWYSKYIRRMQHVPPGTSAIHRENETLPMEEVPPE